MIDFAAELVGVFAETSGFIAELVCFDFSELGLFLSTAEPLSLLLGL